MARALRLELRSTVLETVMLPLHQTLMVGSSYEISSRPLFHQLIVAYGTNKLVSLAPLVGSTGLGPVTPSV